MKALSRIILAAALAPLACACEFRPLVEAGNTHYVRVYIDEQIRNVTEGFYNPEYARPAYRRPEVMKVVLADPESGKVAAERYLRNQGDDERGHYYDGYIICSPGEWSLMAWNFDTEATVVGNQADIRQAAAGTGVIAAHLYSALWSRMKNSQNVIDGTKGDGSRLDAAKDGDVFDNEKIVYEPDHLFVAEEEKVRIGYSGQIDTLRTAAGEYFTAGSIVESWYIQVNVRGVSRLTSSASLMSGMSGDRKLIDGALDPENPVTVYFDMESTSVTKADEDTGVLYSTFSTFGKLPDSKNGFKVTFDIVTKAGKAVSATFDVTDEFSKDIAKEHRWILLDRTIVIPETPQDKPGGGFSPGVNDWKDVNTDLII